MCSSDGLDIISYLSWLYGASFDKHQSLFVYLHWLEGVLMNNNDSVCVRICMCSYVSMYVCVCVSLSVFIQSLKLATSYL